MPYLIIWAILATCATAVSIGLLLKRGAQIGEIVVLKTEDGTTFMLELGVDPDEIVNHSYVSFAVVVRPTEI